MYILLIAGLSDKGLNRINEKHPPYQFKTIVERKFCEVLNNDRSNETVIYI